MKKETLSWFQNGIKEPTCKEIADKLAFLPIYDLVKEIYRIGYNEGSIHTIKSICEDADKSPSTSLDEYFAPYKEWIDKIII